MADEVCRTSRNEFEAIFEEAESLVKVLLRLNDHEARRLFGLLDTLLVKLLEAWGQRKLLAEGMRNLQRAITLRNEMRKVTNTTDACFLTINVVVTSLSMDLESHTELQVEVERHSKATTWKFSVLACKTNEDNFDGKLSISFVDQSIWLVGDKVKRTKLLPRIQLDETSCVAVPSTTEPDLWRLMAVPINGIDLKVQAVQIQLDNENQSQAFAKALASTGFQIFGSSSCAATRHKSPTSSNGDDARPVRQKVVHNTRALIPTEPYVRTSQGVTKPPDRHEAGRKMPVTRERRTPRKKPNYPQLQASSRKFAAMAPDKSAEFEELLEKVEALANVATSLQSDEGLRLFELLKSDLEALKWQSAFTGMPAHKVAQCLQRVVAMRTMLRNGFTLPEDFDATMDRLIGRLIEDMQFPEGSFAASKAKVGDRVTHCPVMSLMESRRKPIVSTWCGARVGSGSGNLALLRDAVFSPTRTAPSPSTCPTFKEFYSLSVPQPKPPVSWCRAKRSR
ncbi:MAG: hypothetical protein Q9174_006151 [Haloplaca sp. 1 TL-2023]